jgi:D-alanine-D-alanine ligase-like ATP-grasp enzyme
MLKKKNTPYLTNLIKKLAPKVGARVVVEPDWEYVAQIRYKNGVVRSIKYLSLDLNHIGSSDIAKDKGYAKFFLEKAGYNVAKGTSVFSPKWAKTIGSSQSILYGKKYAKEIGYPVIVKPNSKSQGVDVCLAWNSVELEIFLRKVFKSDNVALIEKYLPGHDYRIVVLDNKIISAYERVALSLVGDGKSSILKLLKEKQRFFIKNGRDTRINFFDARIRIKLARQGYKFSSVLGKNKKIFLLDNANLSTGGDSLDVTSTIHSNFKKLAINITRDMGLRICGVDIMVTKGDITMDPKKTKYYVIEINSAPGLDHYVTTGPKQKKIVEDMYLEVLKALGKKD